MQLKIGSYSFAANAVEIRARSETRYNKGGQPYAFKQYLDVAGYLYADGQAAITEAMDELYGVLKRPYQDVIFYTDSGAESDTFLKNAGSLSGVTFTRGPDFLKNTGAEYNQERHFEFTAEAEYPHLGTDNILLDFTERLRFRGGGPIYGHKLAVNGPPQKQLLYPASIYRVTQTGRAVGYKKAPKQPGPIWPFALKEGPGDIEQISPDFMGKGYQGYPVSWAYEFESAKALVGVPNLWPKT